MRMILTCRECGYQERGNSESPLMNRIKMWNHIARMHEERGISPRQVPLVMHERSEIHIGQQQESYHLQPAHAH